MFNAVHCTAACYVKLQKYSSSHIPFGFVFHVNRKPEDLSITLILLFLKDTNNHLYLFPVLDSFHFVQNSLVCFFVFFTPRVLAPKIEYDQA